MKTRLFARLARPRRSPNVKHYRGLPPVLTGGRDTRVEDPAAMFLLIEEDPSGVFLYGFGENGECITDTWHLTVDDAKHQADFEYEGTVLHWTEVPESVPDPVEYGMALKEEGTSAQ